MSRYVMTHTMNTNYFSLVNLLLRIGELFMRGQLKKAKNLPPLVIEQLYITLQPSPYRLLRISALSGLLQDVGL